MNQKDLTILGVDPGTLVTGYGLIQVVDNMPKLLAFHELTLSKYADIYAKLKRIFNRTTEIIDSYTPALMAIESPFYGKNVQSMLQLGRAQGAAIAAGLQKNMSVTEYSPKKIKIAITGNGNASKEQVAGMLQHILQEKVNATSLDATDGLAAAVCHFYNYEGKQTKKNYRSWQDFANKNSDVIVK